MARNARRRSAKGALPRRAFRAKSFMGMARFAPWALWGRHISRQEPCEDGAFRAKSLLGDGAFRAMGPLGGRRVR